VTSGPGPDAARPGRPRRQHRLERVLLLGPGLGYLTVLFLVPMAFIVAYSLLDRGRFGGMVPVISLDDFGRALEPVYLRVLGTSLAIAGITTLLALLIGYPTAWAIARLPKRWRLVVLILVVLPFWTNFLVRTYAWIVLLNSEGRSTACSRTLDSSTRPWACCIPRAPWSLACCMPTCHS